MELTFHGILMFLRVISTLYMMVIFPYEIGLLIGMTVTINAYNWWDPTNEENDKNSIFLTNVSWWNSFICWIGWLFMCFIVLALVIFVLVLILVLIKSVLRNGFRTAVMRVCFNTGILLKDFSNAVVKFVLGGYLDEDRF